MLYQLWLAQKRKIDLVVEQVFLPHKSLYHMMPLHNVSRGRREAKGQRKFYV